MFRHDVQQSMLKRNAQDEFRVRNVITRIYEVIHYALSFRSARMHANLQEVGIILTPATVHFHIHILPSSLLIPQQTFVRNLELEGCKVRPMKLYREPEDFHNHDEALRAKCWKSFECPNTRDGIKLADLIARALDEIARQKEALRLQPVTKPSAHTGVFGILKDSGPHQPSYFEVMAEPRFSLAAPPALTVSQWKHDPKFTTV